MEEYYTGPKIAKELGMPITTVYGRFGFKSSPERWGVEVIKDEKTGRYKYAVSAENFEKLWRGSEHIKKPTSNQQRILEHRANAARPQG